MPLRFPPHALSGSLFDPQLSGVLLLSVLLDSLSPPIPSLISPIAVYVRVYILPLQEGRLSLKKEAGPRKSVAAHPLHALSVLFLLQLLEVRESWWRPWASALLCGRSWLVWAVVPSLSVSTLGFLAVGVFWSLLTLSASAVFTSESGHSQLPSSPPCLSSSIITHDITALLHAVCKFLRCKWILE